MEQNLKVILSGQTEDKTSACIASYPTGETDGNIPDDVRSVYRRLKEPDGMYMLWLRDNTVYIGRIIKNDLRYDTDGVKLLSLIFSKGAYLEGKAVVNLLSTLLEPDGNHLVSNCAEQIATAGIIENGSFIFPQAKVKKKVKYAYRVYNNDEELFELLSFYNQEVYRNYDYICFVPANQEYGSDGNHVRLNDIIERRYNVKIDENDVKANSDVWDSNQSLTLKKEGYCDYQINDSNMQFCGLRLIIDASRVPFERKFKVVVKGIDDDDRFKVKVIYNGKKENEEVTVENHIFKLTREQCERSGARLRVTVEADGYEQLTSKFCIADIDDNITIEMKQKPKSVSGHFEAAKGAFRDVLERSESRPITSFSNLSWRVGKRWMYNHAQAFVVFCLALFVICPLLWLGYQLLPGLQERIDNLFASEHSNVPKIQYAPVVKPTDSVFAYLKNTDVWKRDTLRTYSLPYDSCLIGGDIVKLKRLYLDPRHDTLANAKVREIVKVYMSQKIENKEFMDNIIKNHVTDTIVNLSTMLSSLNDFVKTKKNDKNGEIE